MLAKAIAIAAKAFENKKDKGGKPYILHLLRVMNGVDQNDEELMSIAIMHDLLEDLPHEWDIERISAEGFSDRVCNALWVLTHDGETPYHRYIERVSLNADARLVKLSDLKDNSNYLRLKEVNEKSFESMKKYHASFLYLSKPFKDYL